jgi:hypothetical protein
MQITTTPDPVRKLSTATDPNDKSEEQRRFDIVFTSDRDSWKARNEKLEDGMVSAYATIMTDYCTKLMRDRIEEHPDFESKILNYPIELLKPIKVLIHAPKRAQYPILDWLNTLKRFIDLRQNPNEALSDYYKRFTQEYDTFKALFGIRMFDHAAEHLQEYIDGGATEQIKKKKEVFAALTGLMLMEHSDQSRYGSLNEKMNSDYSLNIDVYLRAKEKALDALANPKLDKKPH